MAKQKKKIKGITERSDGRYTVKYTDKNHKIHQTTKKDLQSALEWLNEVQYKANNNISLNDSSMTVNQLYEKWFYDITHRGGTSIKDNTQLNYEGNYRRYCKDIIGDMKVVDVKPTHCREIFDRLYKDDYAIGTQVRVYETLGTMFKWAKEQDIISKHPLDTIKKPVQVTKYSEEDEEDDEAEILKCNFFTIEEEKKFLMVAKDYAHYEEFFLMLNTGMRLGEVISLRWSCVDMDNRVIKIRRTGMYRSKWLDGSEGWKWNTPKSKTSFRDIKMTDDVYKLFLVLKEKESNVKEKTPKEMQDLVFLNRNGFPTRHANYASQMIKVCEKAGVKHIRCHDLRHTFATRFCEQSKDYYFLAKMMGHKTIDITIKTYVHQTENERQKEIDNLSKYFADNGIKLM